MLVIIGIMAWPWHFQAGKGEYAEIGSALAGWAVATGMILGVLLGTATSVLALRSGVRALERMEF